MKTSEIVEMLVEAFDYGVDYMDDGEGMNKEHISYKRSRAIYLEPIIARLTKENNDQ